MKIYNTKGIEIAHKIGDKIPAGYHVLRGGTWSVTSGGVIVQAQVGQDGSPELELEETPTSEKISPSMPQAALDVMVEMQEAGLLPAYVEPTERTAWSVSAGSVENREFLGVRSWRCNGKRDSLDAAIAASIIEDERQAAATASAAATLAELIANDEANEAFSQSIQLKVDCGEAIHNFDRIRGSGVVLENGTQIATSIAISEKQQHSKYDHSLSGSQSPTAFKKYYFTKI